MLVSFLDNDFYKFTMMQAVWLSHPEAQVCYKFINQRETDCFLDEAIARIRSQVAELAEARFTEEEILYLRRLCFFRDDFLDFLSEFMLKAEQVQITSDADVLGVRIEGFWVDTILQEVPLMAIISDSYFACVRTGWNHDLGAYIDKTREKARRLTAAGCRFADFGTGRRRSYQVHDAAIRALKDEGVQCSGTSNLHFAMRYDLVPIGTMAHEWIMGFARIYGAEESNREALQTWREIYGDDLGVALTDTYTTKFFFENIKGVVRTVCSFEA